MQQRGFSPRTQQSYLASVSRLAQCFHRSPEQISLQALQPYFNYLAQKRKLCGASCRLHLHGIRFFYLNVLQQRSFDVSLILSKCQRGIPELLTQDEVRLICLAIESEGLLVALRCFWRQCRSPGWLFPEQKPGCHLAIDSAQRCFSQAKQRTGAEKKRGIYGVRHAYAIHQLHAGMRVEMPPVPLSADSSAWGFFAFLFHKARVFWLESLRLLPGGTVRVLQTSRHCA